MNRQKSLSRIAELLGRFTNEVKILNAASLYDINIHSETILIPLLNEAMDLNLVNANFDQEKNFSAVDLIDTKNRVAIQVTSTADNEKIKHTLNQFVKYERYNDFDILFIYIISEKQASYTGKGHEEIINGKFTFDKDTSILDNEELFNRVNGLISLQKIAKIEELLEAEFTDAKIESRRSKLESPEAEKHEEMIFPNILEAIIPADLYIADLNLNREAIIKQTWTEKYKLKMDASDRKVLKKALRYDEKSSIADWYTVGSQILTFRDLHGADEPLRDYIDVGTITKIGTEEYWSTNESNQRNFTALLRFTLQEKLKPKAIDFVDKEGIYRFSSERKVIMSRTITWKKTKRATRSVLSEVYDKDKTKITCFKHYAFYTNFFYFNEKWYLSINPTWSFTVDGWLKSGLSKFYASGMKRLENNKSIYYGFRFIAYCLNNQINEEPNYPLLSFQDPEYAMISTAYKVAEDETDCNDEDTIIENDEH